MSSFESVPVHQLERISKEARRLAYQMADGGPAYYDYQPGNGTRYELVLVSDNLLKGGPIPGVQMERSNLVVSLLNFQASHVFAMSGTLDAGYISEKLRVGQADGYALAYLFNEIAHHSR